MSLQTPNNGSNTAPLLLAAEIKCEAGLFTFSADSWPSRHLYTLANWGPEALFPQLLGPHIPLHSGAHIFDSFPPFPSEIHTHTNIIFSPFDVYFNRSHQFTMLVRESVFSWLAISKKADLWRHNFKVSDIFYSVTLCLSLCFSRVSHSGLAEFTFSFDSASFFDSASYFRPFSFLIQFVTCTGTGNTVWFSCFLHILRLSVIWSDFLSQVSFYRSSDTPGHIPCLERQKKCIRIEERVKNLIWKGDFMKRDVGWWGFLWQARAV